LRVLFDTSVLVAAMIEGHADHDRCLPWLERGHRGGFEFLVAAHSVAELYAVLSTYPTRPRLSAALAARLVRENVAAKAHVIALTGADHNAVVAQLAAQAIVGGAVYDALIARAAHKGKADRLLTLNPRDFERVWTGRPGVVAVP
jgi:predicted nucleic acid-binding protein